MGDPTAKWAGRLTLDPRKHLDLIGSLMLLVFGFGWAKPVPVNFSNLRDQRKGLIFVSSAGITANIIVAFFSLLILRLFPHIPFDSLRVMLTYMAQINIILASFNLIPIPPLDGSKILMGFFTGRVRYFLMSIEPYGMFIVIALLWLRLLDPLIYFFRWVILSIIGIFLP